jgi:benzylsuccinate CoA-transferase BbsF subunit
MERKNMKGRPFEGLNVLDFTWAGVGPLTANYLAFYGATVIKLEFQKRPDVMRTLAPFKDGKPGLERSYHFSYVQMGKRYSITLNLDHPKGIELAKKLISWADVVVESWATGALEKMGLDYDHVKEIKPDIIMLRTCMHGHTGPLAKVHGHGFVLTGLSGLDGLTGWPDRSPAGLYGPFTDHVAPLFGAISLIAALDYRRRTGKGMYIDQSQHESVLHWVAPLILNWVVNQQELHADGNRIPYAAPHGVYRCRGDDRWCSIAIFTDSEWTRFCDVIENPALAEDPRFATLEDRKKNEDVLDGIVTAWTEKHTNEEVMGLLQAAGIAAGIASNGKDQAADPQLEHYQFFNQLEHPETGTLSFYHGPLFRLSKLPFELGRPPLLGEHNDYVYTKILGLSDEEFVTFITEGVI